MYIPEINLKTIGMITYSITEPRIQAASGNINRRPRMNILMNLIVDMKKSQRNRLNQLVKYLSKMHNIPVPIINDLRKIKGKWDDGR